MASRLPALLRSVSRCRAGREIPVRAAASASAPAADRRDFDALSKKLREMSALGGISGLLSWDEMTMMPAGAAQARADQKATLAAVLHSKQADPELGETISRLLASPMSEFDAFEQATVREAARAFRKASAVTEDLVVRSAQLESRGYHAWAQARQNSDWSLFAPVLQDWVDARRERAKLIDPDRPAYDVLADDFSAGLTAERISEVFGAVRDGLVPLLEEIRKRGVPPETSWLAGDYDVAKQAELSREVAVALGFDLQKGRLDVSVHPFTGGAHPTDVRMTTRFKQGDLMEGLTGTIHETGHAMYEQGRNLRFDGLPVNEHAGMVIHESQSLLWERMVGLGRPFACFLLPKLQATFPGCLERDAEALYAAINAIKERSAIRVEADEVTYPLHVILRFELERGLIDGSIAVEDVPGLWREKMRDYLGVEVASDAEGCLQDVHWSAGLFGYFPTYSLGAMAAVQIYEAAERDLPLRDNISRGDFGQLRDWLGSRIYSVGCLHPSADDLLQAATGRPLDPDIFLRYLTEKYTELYRL